MDALTRELVRKRAVGRCEYCRLPEIAVPYFVFHVNHIIAKQHVDEISDDPEGLAWACRGCNYHKSPNLVRIDPETKDQVSIFNPRTDDWTSHLSLPAQEVCSPSQLAKDAPSVRSCVVGNEI